MSYICSHGRRHRTRRHGRPHSSYMGNTIRQTLVMLAGILMTVQSIVPHHHHHHTIVAIDELMHHCCQCEQPAQPGQPAAPADDADGCCPIEHNHALTVRTHGTRTACAPQPAPDPAATAAAHAGAPQPAEAEAAPLHHPLAVSLHSRHTGGCRSMRAPPRA